MPDIQCFMVERVRKRTVLEPCEEHPKGHKHRVFDVRRVGTEEILATEVSFMAAHQLPAGAMWFENVTSASYPTGPDDWDHPNLKKPTPDAKRSPSHVFADGPQLYVMTPGGPWNIDSRASNCTKPYDYEHRCWQRTGEPPDVTAGKDPPTCDAGAGSIQANNYHGLLRDGKLVDA